MEKGDKFEDIVRRAHEGEIPCIQWLATIYFEGDGVHVDLKKAERFFRGGCALGDTWCCFQLATEFIFYENKDLYFKTIIGLADNGYLPAMYKAGICYRDGVGTNSDKILSKTFLERASAGGHFFATRELLDCEWKTADLLVRFRIIIVKFWLELRQRFVTRFSKKLDQRAVY